MMTDVIPFVELHSSTHGPNPQLNLPRQTEALELVLICAQDIVDNWPNTTMRTLGEMTKRIDTLRQALESLNR